MAPKKNPKKKGKKSQDTLKNDKDGNYETLTEEPKEKTSVRSSLLEGFNEEERKASTNQTEDNIATSESSGGAIGRTRSILSSSGTFLSLSWYQNSLQNIFLPNTLKYGVSLYLILIIKFCAYSWVLNFNQNKISKLIRIFYSVDVFA